MKEENKKQINKNVSFEREAPKMSREEKQYCPERRTVQILDLLKKYSDEKHVLSQKELLEIMKENCPTTENAVTLSHAIDEILLQINPYIYEEENRNQYQIKYKGYKNQEENIIEKKQEIEKQRKIVYEEIRKRKKDNKIEGFKPQKIEKAPSITELQYVHDFSFRELDQLMDAISFSSHLSDEDKINLMSKLHNTTSVYYKSPFFDKKTKKLRFNEKAIYRRIDEKDKPEDHEEIYEAIKVIQEAINRGCKVKFFTNRYNENNEKEEKHNKTVDGMLTVSPYYIVVYNDMYYLIAGMTGYGRASHYRIDLLSKVQLAVDTQKKSKSASKKEKYIKIDPIREFSLLPLKEKWDPEKYMREHMNMSYEDPVICKFKFKRGNYTVLHDWFGKYYKRSKCEDEDYEWIRVTCSPNSFEEWAYKYRALIKEYSIGKKE